MFNPDMGITADTMIDALRQRGLRITKARRAVCRVLADAHSHHLTAPDIHRLTESETDLSIDQSTIYRTLETLEEAGLVKHTHLGHTASAYHLADEPPHQHLVCRVCGSVKGIAQADLAEYVAVITRLTGFRPDPTHYALSGLCADCDETDVSPDVRSFEQPDVPTEK